jgi:hypothetical protein
MACIMAPGVRCKRKRQAQRGRQLSAEQARPEDPDRNVETGARHRLDPLPGSHRVKIALQLNHVLGKLIDIADQAPPEGPSNGLIASRGPSQPEIDAAGK